jgi:hypothetical protein
MVIEWGVLGSTVGARWDHLVQYRDGGECNFIDAKAIGIVVGVGEVAGCSIAMNGSFGGLR